MRRALTAALILSLPAFAQEKDAPTKEPIVLTEERGIEIAQYVKQLEAENVELKKQLPAIPPWALALIVGVVAAGAGVGGGYAIASAVKK